MRDPLTHAQVGRAPGTTQRALLPRPRGRSWAAGAAGRCGAARASVAGSADTSRPWRSCSISAACSCCLCAANSTCARAPRVRPPLTLTSALCARVSCKVNPSPEQHLRERAPSVSTQVREGLPHRRAGASQPWRPGLRSKRPGRPDVPCPRCTARALVAVRRRAPRGRRACSARARAEHWAGQAPARRPGRAGRRRSGGAGASSRRTSPRTTATPRAGAPPRSGAAACARTRARNVRQRRAAHERCRLLYGRTDRCHFLTSAGMPARKESKTCHRARMCLELSSQAFGNRRSMPCVVLVLN
jgi:hypothetical protein